MTTALQIQENGTITLTITIPQKLVDETKAKLLKNYAKNVELPGFRKGKAPKKLVEEKINQEKLREDILRELLPQAYVQGVTQHSLKPIMNPKIHVEKVEEGKDWQFTAMTCETPVVDLNGYKDAVQKVTAKSKIVVPGKEEKQPNFDEIVKKVLENVKMQIPEILLEQEVERVLSQTLDEIKKLGLTLDQYLTSTGRKPEDLREEYKKKAENDIKFEFALQKIADTEKITVDEKEIDEAIAKAKDEKEREHLTANRYLLANILRQQKTLDFLRTL